jgi:penicillin amidase
MAVNIFRKSLVLAAFLAGAAVLPVQAAAPGAETLAAPGLKEPVEIIRDRFGINHIYAKNEHDLFFAQGYGAARDRLFQLELWRRQATGTMSEVLGKKALKRDIGNRLFRFRGDMAKELAWYHPNGAAIVGAFAEGVNAYIAETERNPALLTPEFGMLGLKPGRWTPEVVVSRFNGLLYNLNSEIPMAKAVKALGPAKVKEIERFQPAEPTNLDLDPIIDTEQLTPQVLELFRAYKTPLRFTAEDLAPEFRNPKSAAFLDSEMPSSSQAQSAAADEGSNNWAVSGKMTMSGHPVLAADPHRALETPSLRYWVHLNAPGWNVIGGGEPSLPGVSMGHNDFFAWSMTIFNMDVEDLYVYETNPSNPKQYKFGNGWETMTEVNDTIAVKGAAAEQVTLKYTRHGPVVFEDTANRKAYAVRAAWHEIGNAPYLASLRVNQAKSGKEFVETTQYWRAPAMNMIWADRAGNIGYKTAGLAPKRPRSSGLIPVVGDGRYEWDGYLPYTDLGEDTNPERGYHSTGNDFQVPTGYKFIEAMPRSWTDPFRNQSIREILESGRKFTVADMVQMQNNNMSIPARSIVPLLSDIEIPNAVSRKAADRLLRWNRHLDKDSVEAGIYEMFQRRLMVNMDDVIVPKEAQADVGGLSMTRVIEWLNSPDGRFGANPLAGRDAVLVKSLDEAVAELNKRLGPDMEKWTLGGFHYARIRSRFVPGTLKPELEAQYDVGNLPRGGDSYTITATGGADNQGSGGSFKMVYDLEHWDNSVGMNTPGQSGNVNDPHYRDLYELWARGKYFPVAFSRAKVESIAEKTTVLSPK